MSKPGEDEMKALGAAVGLGVFLGAGAVLYGFIEAVLEQAAKDNGTSK
ncbi:Uncharacterised protein [Mycobacteroides abscessus]|nr:hypothetical protein [Mycobacteroides abscessus]CPU62658.1 Uncharacterised protein [Mycobacteroides abscessus]CPX67868.1 Uncharacterised protein [Mycobacteroides abscessus]CPZ70137.1 Uncharacterised protein [Mycobacteroides abscessus]